MIAYLLYNRRTPGEGRVQDLAKRLRPYQVDTDMIDADSPRGVQLAESYDLMGRPAVLLVRDDGSPMQAWQGEDQLPSPNDVSYLAHS